MKHQNIVIVTARDYEMALWKVQEIYDNHWPATFFEEIEKAVEMRKKHSKLHY